MIFIHSSFRVSSTWFWSRLRNLDKVLAYYEIFNALLATMRKGDVDSFHPEAWNSKHPETAPYFREFLPLIRASGGVENFDAAMALDGFIPSGGIFGPLDETQRIYIKNLIRHAENIGKVPVLSACRSLGRMRAIKDRFPGLHVVLYRPLFQQWCSYSEQLYFGYDYFFDSIRLIIDNNSHDNFFNKLKSDFNLDKMTVDSDNYFICFILTHLYVYANVIDVADLIVEVDRLSLETPYRIAVERQLSAEIGAEVDFSSASRSSAFSFAALGQSQKLFGEISRLAEPIFAAAPSAAGRKFAERALKELFEEAGNYDFYAGRLARLVRSRDVAMENRPLPADIAALVAQNKALDGEMKEMRAKLEGLRGRVDQIPTKQ